MGDTFWLTDERMLYNRWKLRSETGVFVRTMGDWPLSELGGRRP